MTYNCDISDLSVTTMQAVTAEEAVGVLKVNSRILEAHELKKLDKSEKSLVNAIHITGKGRVIFH